MRGYQASTDNKKPALDGWMYNRYSGVFSFVIVHDNPQYGGELYTVTGYCQAICCPQLDL
jgi:hypothetical protein